MNIQSVLTEIQQYSRSAQDALSTCRSLIQKDSQPLSMAFRLPCGHLHNEDKVNAIFQEAQPTCPVGMDTFPPECSTTIETEKDSLKEDLNMRAIAPIIADLSTNLTFLLEQIEEDSQELLALVEKNRSLKKRAKLVQSAGEISQPEITDSLNAPPKILSYKTAEEIHTLSENCLSHVKDVLSGDPLTEAVRLPCNHLLNSSSVEQIIAQSKVCGSSDYPTHSDCPECRNPILEGESLPPDLSMRTLAPAIVELATHVQSLFDKIQSLPELKDELLSEHEILTDLLTDPDTAIQKMSQLKIAISKLEKKKEKEQKKYETIIETNTRKIKQNKIEIDTLKEELEREEDTAQEAGFNLIQAQNLVTRLENRNRQMVFIALTCMILFISIGAFYFMSSNKDDKPLSGLKKGPWDI